MYFLQPGARRAGRAHVADRVQQHDAVVGHQRVHLGEELAVVVHADVLEHADRDDAVEAVRRPRGSRAARSGRGRTGPAARAFSLESACCSFDSVTPVTSTSSMRREIERQIAPAAADIEDLAGPASRLSLAAIRRSLFCCACSERLVVVEEIGAGILHALVEEELVEVVAEVVVVRDVLLRLADRVGLLEALQGRARSAAAPSAAGRRRATAGSSRTA